ncbi:MAG: hypothetical protein H0T78_07755 [Longispora sp.]|nr:hypothetical protein [Longispora sp. (in: high G+C Gram-positive bacteria)]
MAKPAMNLSRKKLNTNVIGTVTSTVAACRDCQKLGPETNEVLPARDEWSAGLPNLDGVHQPSPHAVLARWEPTGLSVDFTW